MKKPVPQLHADLAGAIREVLERAPQAVNVAKLRALLPGPYKVPPKLKDALLGLLAEEARAGRIYAWPGEKFWGRDLRVWAEPAMLAAADGFPVAVAKVLGAVSKQMGKAAAEALLSELLAGGQLIRVPLFGGAKAKLSSRIADTAAFRAELDAARAVIEAGYRRLGGAAPELTRDAPGLNGPALPVTATEEPAGPVADVDKRVLDALGELEPQKGLLVTAPRLYRALPATAKADVDAALVRLQDARRVILHRHSNPQSQSGEELIANLYVGACWRVDQG